jgi:hypothetical protein
MLAVEESRMRFDWHVLCPGFPASAPMVAARVYRQGAYREVEVKVGPVLVLLSFKSNE